MAVTCPVCGQADALRRVSTVLDEGTSVTAGSAITLTPSGSSAIPFNASPTFYSGATMTALAARLAPPPRPACPSRTVFLWGWFGTAGGIAILMTIPYGWVGFVLGIFSAFLTWAIGLFAVAIGRNAYRKKYAGLAAIWDQRAARYRAAYYCGRDDVIVEGGGTFQPSAQFRARVFAIK